MSTITYYCHFSILLLNFLSNPLFYFFPFFKVTRLFLLVTAHSLTGYILSYHFPFRSAIATFDARGLRSAIATFDTRALRIFTVCKIKKCLQLSTYVFSVIFNSLCQLDPFLIIPHHSVKMLKFKKWKVKLIFLTYT